MPTLSYASHRVLMRWLRGIATPAPTALQVGVLLQSPNPDGTGIVEPPASGGYARRPITLSEEVVSNGVTSCSNTNAIVFPTATQNWPSATYLGVFTSQGELLFYGPLAAARAVGQGDALAFGEGTIQLRLK